MNFQDSTECPICKGTVSPVASQPEKPAAIHFNCPRCGLFRCAEEAIGFNESLPSLSTAERVRLSGAIREQSERAPADRFPEWPLILPNNIGSYLSNAPARFDIPTMVRKLLSAIQRLTNHSGEWIDFPDKTSYPLAYAENFDEWDYLTGYATQLGWIEKDRHSRSGSIQLRLTPAGWEELQRRPRIESSQGFVAMWFDPSMTDAFTNGLKAAVEDDCHYRCRRIDAKEYNGDVVDEIMAEIRESRFVVCDLTEHRNGVYFEAGFAMGLGIPTIWTCHEDHARGTHFDAEHFNQIRWATADELRKKLATRIRATIGLGRLVPAKN